MVNVEPLCCTPETNMRMYVNNTSIKKDLTFKEEKDYITLRCDIVVAE